MRLTTFSPWLIVPTIWSRFKYVADDLLRGGKADIYCLKCNSKVKPEIIASNDDRFQAGWNFDRIVCPQGHNLLVGETVHYVKG